METFLIIILAIILIQTSYLIYINNNKASFKNNENMIFVDTSALMDGRIVAIARSGFLVGKVLIPRSVIGELQFVADHSDSEKRSRARLGLDIVFELQNIPDCNVEIFKDNVPEKEVDDKLLVLAKKYKAAICTVDYNLNKVAKVEGIKVLNVNDLAMNLRSAFLPGEKLSIELTQKGQENGQAIGHLSDGTMVVVEQANRLVGKNVEVEIIRSLQTAAGKMMFAKLVSQNNISKKTFNKTKTNNQNNNRKTQSKRYNNTRKSKPADREQNFINLINKN